VAQLSEKCNRLAAEIFQLCRDAEGDPSVDISSFPQIWKYGIV
jgi:hypothetical protein